MLRTRRIHDDVRHLAQRSQLLKVLVGRGERTNEGNGAFGRDREGVQSDIWYRQVSRPQWLRVHRDLREERGLA